MVKTAVKPSLIAALETQASSLKRTTLIGSSVLVTDVVEAARVLKEKTGAARGRLLGDLGRLIDQIDEML